MLVAPGLDFETWDRTILFNQIARSNDNAGAALKRLRRSFSVHLSV
jgi:hypothetical protein